MSTWWILVAIGCMVLHVVIFRDIVASIPSILKGEAVAASEELIPFFDWQSQLFDQIITGYSDLTRDTEIRVAYSFATTWVRHWAVLPFMLVFLNAASLLLLILSSYNIVCALFSEVDKRSALLAAVAGSVPIHCLVLYAKVTHFYTLVMGFALFALSLSLLVRGLSGRKTDSLRYFAAGAFFDLVNPSVQFHVLGIVGWGLVAVAYVLLPDNRSILKERAKLVAHGVAVFIGVSVIPYAILTYVIILRRSAGIAISIPTTFNMLRASSVSAIRFFTLETAAPVTNYIKGSYFLERSSWSLLAYSVAAIMVAGADLLVRLANRCRVIDGSRLNVLAVITCLLPASLWMSLGPEVPGTFHSLAGGVGSWLYQSPSSLAEPLLSVLHSVLQVLRFPHRFQFIGFASVMFLLTYLAFLGIRRLRTRNHWKSMLWAALVCVVFLMPLALSTQGVVLLSGNYAGMLAPYPLTSDIRSIKKILTDELTLGERVLTLPSVNGGLFVRDENGVLHAMHDKFYIYFFNRPSILYAYGNVVNVLDGFLIYEALELGPDVWLNSLLNLGVKYVVLNKATEPRPNGGKVYMPAAGEQMESVLCDANRATALFEGEYYSLYRLESASLPIYQESSINFLSWLSYINVIRRQGMMSESIKQPVSLSRLDVLEDWATLTPPSFELVEGEHMSTVLSTLGITLQHEGACFWDDQQLDLDIVLKQEGKTFHTPDIRILPFTDDVRSILEFQTPMFSLFALKDPSNHWNAFAKPLMGSYGSITGLVLALQSGAQVRIPINIQEEGRIALYLRAFLGSQSIVATQVEDFTLMIHVTDLGPVAGPSAYRYFPLGSMESGKIHHAVIVNVGDRPVVIEGIATVHQ
jgi:hypothetical protein